MSQNRNKLYVVFKASIHLGIQIITITVSVGVSHIILTMLVPSSLSNLLIFSVNTSWNAYQGEVSFAGFEYCMVVLEPSIA